MKTKCSAAISIILWIGITAANFIGSLKIPSHFCLFFQSPQLWMILVLINLFLLEKWFEQKKLKCIIFRISIMLFVFKYLVQQILFEMKVQPIHIVLYCTTLFWALVPLLLIFSFFYGTGTVPYGTVLKKCFNRTRLVVSTKKLVVLDFL